MKTKFPILFLLALLPILLFAQGPRIQATRKALDVGVYDYSKVKKKNYKVYYDEEADAKFLEVLMKSDRLKNFGPFGVYITYENDSTVFFMEQEAYEYCPELNYVMITGGHGYVSAYDLETLEEIFVNPSTYVYSPSGKYRFGSFEYDGMKYYVEIKEGDKYVSQLFYEGYKNDMHGVYWEDDNTMHYLKDHKKNDGTIYQIGYSLTFLKPEPPQEESSLKTNTFECDSIYPNKGYSITLSWLDSTEFEDETTPNTLFTLKKDNIVIFSDSIYSSLQQIEYKDFNGDNVADILIQHSSSSRSNWTYTFYLVNTIADRLTKIKGFEKISNLAYLSDHDIVTNYVLSGTNWTNFYNFIFL